MIEDGYNFIYNPWMTCVDVYNLRAFFIQSSLPIFVLLLNIFKNDWYLYKDFAIRVCVKDVLLAKWKTVVS